MRKIYFLFILSYLFTATCNNLTAQDYNNDEVKQLEDFLKQGDNAQVLNVDFSNQDWFKTMEGVTWTEWDNEYRVNDISWWSKEISGTLSLNNFPNLFSLYCTGSNLNSLELLNLTSLNMVDCSFSGSLSTLDISGTTSISILNCSSTSISSLNLSGLAYLMSLDCSGTLITDLDLSGLTNLGDLNCAGTSISSLNLSEQTKLIGLNCSSTSISSLNLSNLPNLAYLYCSSMYYLENLSLSNLPNLQRLEIQNTSISELSLTGLTSLISLNCSMTNLRSLNVSDLPNLETIDCSNTVHINSIELTNLPSLISFDCSGSHDLYELTASNLPVLQTLKTENTLIDGTGLTGITSLEYFYTTRSRIALSVLYQILQSNPSLKDYKWDEQYRLFFAEKEINTGESVDINPEYIIGGVTSRIVIIRNNEIIPDDNVYYTVGTDGKVTFHEAGNYYIKIINDLVKDSDGNGYATPGQIIVTNTIGINDTDYKPKVSANMDTKTGNLQINNADGYALKIINSSGITLHQQVLSSNNEAIGIRHMSSGVYIVLLTQKEDTVIEKIIK